MNFEIEDWLPKSVILLRNYDRHKFVCDLIAGVTVGLVAPALATLLALRDEYERIAKVAKLAGIVAE